MSKLQPELFGNMPTWPERYAEILDGLGGKRISISELLEHPTLPPVTESTKRQHLRNFLVQRPDHAITVIGFFPPPEAVIAYVESKIGPVTDDNIEQANEECRLLMTAIGRPILESFVVETLGITGVVVTVPKEALFDFLIEDFSDFIRGAGNGLVSMAGKLNEALLVAAMRNQGMQDKTDYVCTGKDSSGDIVIKSHIGTGENLSVEVKSYHARERLLRGLQDITGLKVGAGFFKKPQEFNPRRTKTLLQADPAAIYMPNATLEGIAEEARLIATNSKIAFQSRLYRPLTRFASDMQHFNQNGVLPDFK